MSVHDPRPAGKPRRLGLYLPFLLLLLAAVAWTVFWFWARGEAQARMDAIVAGLGRAGYQIAWKDRTIGGYPFRMDITLSDARVRAPSGWALQAPRLEGEAYAYTPTHWVMAAPQGLTFVRPQGGPVAVSGGLRAGLTDFDRRPPSFDFQGSNVTFAPTPGALPFALQAAKNVEFHLRAGPDDEGGVFLRVDQGRAQLTGLLGRVAGDKPINLVWNSTLSKMSAFTGADWAEAVRRWADAGGQMNVRQGQLTAGEALVETRSGTLTAGRDGRVRGVLDLTLRQAPRALGAMAESGVLPRPAADAAAAVASARQADGETAHAALHFEAGQTTLGPVALGPSPKVYDVR